MTEPFCRHAYAVNGHCPTCGLDGVTPIESKLAEKPQGKKTDLVNICIQALRTAGCEVTPRGKQVVVVFPPQDEYDPPDGVEITYDINRFKLVVTREFFRLAEEQVIDEYGRARKEV